MLSPSYACVRFILRTAMYTSHWPPKRCDRVCMGTALMGSFIHKHISLLIKFKPVRNEKKPL